MTEIVSVNYSNLPVIDKTFCTRLGLVQFNSIFEGNAYVLPYEMSLLNVTQ